MVKQNYPTNALIDCCPECKSNTFIKIKEPTGFFEFDRYHYECQKCRCKFEHPSYLSVVPSKPINEIIKKFVKKEISEVEFKKLLRGYYIYI